MPSSLTREAWDPRSDLAPVEPTSNLEEYEGYKRPFHDTELRCAQNGLRFTLVVFDADAQVLGRLRPPSSFLASETPQRIPTAAHKATSTLIWLSAFLRHCAP